MISGDILPVIIVLIVLYVGALILSFFVVRYAMRASKKREHEARQRMYELAILKEIADRTGYSLNIKKILDVITGSLGQFVEYCAVSYMLIEPSKILFKADLKHSISPAFIKDIKDRMLGSLSALSGKDFSHAVIEDTVEGAIPLEDTESAVRSYFNIPLVISGNLVGVLTVAHTKEGLYKEEEMALLYKILAQASQAVTKLEEVIRIEQEKIAATLESMVEGVVMTDNDYRLVAANPTARTIIGTPEHITPTIFDFLDAFKGIIDMRGKLEEAIKLDKTITLNDLFFKGKYYQLVVSPVKSNTGITKGQLLGGVVIFHDITHEKEAEKMKADFASMMVHELRAPLGNIKKIGQMFQTIKALPELSVAQEYAGMVYESSASMLDLVNDLLDVAKLESGKFELVKQAGNLSEVISDRIKFFTPRAQGDSITIDFYEGANIPKIISFDVDRIKQVLNNLISNALNYTPKGGAIKISLFLHKQGGKIIDEALPAVIFWANDEARAKAELMPESVVVVVSDSGEGISPENIEKLWNKFTQFEFSVRNRGDNKGTGLGLVVVKGVVEAHGGIAGLGSRVGTGTTSYFMLPR